MYAASCGDADHFEAPAIQNCVGRTPLVDGRIRDGPAVEACVAEALALEARIREGPAIEARVGEAPARFTLASAVCSYHPVFGGYLVVLTIPAVFGWIVLCDGSPSDPVDRNIYPGSLSVFLSKLVELWFVARRGLAHELALQVAKVTQHNHLPVKFVLKIKSQYCRRRSCLQRSRAISRRTPCRNGGSSGKEQFTQICSYRLVQYATLTPRSQTCSPCSNI